MTRHSPFPIRSTLIGLMVLTIVGCTNLSGSGRGNQGVIFGRVWYRDLDTGRERPIDRGCRLEVVTAHQRISGSTKEGASFRLQVPETGTWPLNLYYKHLVLTTEVNAFRVSSEVNLYVEYFDGEYRLRMVPVDPNPTGVADRSHRGRKPVAAIRKLAGGD